MKQTLDSDAVGVQLVATPEEAYIPWMIAKNEKCLLVMERSLVHQSTAEHHLSSSRVLLVKSKLIEVPLGTIAFDLPC